MTSPQKWGRKAPFQAPAGLFHLLLEFLEALVAAIAPYLRDPDLAKQQGRRALEFVRANFSLEAEARGIRAVYDRLWSGEQKPITLRGKGQTHTANA